MAPEPVTDADGKTSPYPKLIAIIKGLRKTTLSVLLLLSATSLIYYWFSPQLFTLIQNHLHQKLVFFTVAEPFLAHIKLALTAAILTLLPVIVTCLWRALAKPFALNWLSQLLFITFTSILFYLGALFCYIITLKYGIEFLLGFSSDQLQPVISIGKFVNFVTVFVLGFGLIFELPIAMVFFAKTGLIPRQVFEKNRRYALLAISIVASILTPTPDIFNLLLMGGPLYALYEAGIIVLRVMRIP